MSKIQFCELKEVFETLNRLRLKPMLCDSPVECYNSKVQAGQPTHPGDVSKGEYLMLPREWVGLRPVFVVEVRGDSMKDAGLHEGDRLRVEVVEEVNDGDIVVASIDGEYTVKTYFGDEEGNRWLVPRNENYNPILLTEEMDIRILGRVANIIKAVPRTSYTELMRSIKRATMHKQEAPTSTRMAYAIQKVAEKVKNARQWYAVYRALVSKKALNEGEHEEFVRMVKTLLPDHKHPANERELRRMEVQSLRKSPHLWDKRDAPVAGKRFEDYLHLAQQTMEAFTEESV